MARNDGSTERRLMCNTYRQYGLLEVEASSRQLSPPTAAADYALEPALAVDYGSTAVGAARAAGSLDNASSDHFEPPVR
jgi:hypothetical protein